MKKLHLQRFNLGCKSSELKVTQMNTQRYNFQTGQFEPLPAYLQNPNYTADFDDLYTAEDYDRRQAERDGWTESVWDGR